MSIRNELRKNILVLLMVSLTALFVSALYSVWQSNFSFQIYSQHLPMIKSAYDVKSYFNVMVGVSGGPVDLESGEAVTDPFFNRVGEFERQNPEQGFDFENLNIDQKMNHIFRWHWRVQDLKVASSERYDAFLRKLKVLNNKRFELVTMTIEQFRLEGTSFSEEVHKRITDYRGYSGQQFSALEGYLRKRSENNLHKLNYMNDKSRQVVQLLPKFVDMMNFRERSMVNALIELDHEFNREQFLMLNNKLFVEGEVANIWEESILKPGLLSLNQAIDNFESHLNRLLEARVVRVSTANKVFPFLIAAVAFIVLFQSKSNLKNLYRRILEPTQSLIEAASHLTKNVYSDDIPVYGDDEISELTKTFNQMKQTIKSNTLELQNSEQYLSDVITTAGDAIITTDDYGVVEEFNPAAEKLFGYKKVEILGKNISKLVPEPHCQQHDDYIKRYLRTGDSVMMNGGREAQGITKSGAPVDVHINLAHLVHNNSDKFIAVVKDHTDLVRKRNELVAAVDSLQHKHELQKRLSDLYRMNLEEQSLRAFCKVCESMLQSLLNHSKVAIYHLDEGGSEPALTRESKTNFKIYGNSENLLLSIINSKGSINISDIDKLGFHIEAGSIEFDAVQYYAVPLLYDQEIIGVVEVISPRAFDDNDIEFIEQAIPYIAVQVSLYKQRDKTQILLAQTMKQKDELNAQKSHLNEINTELRSQASELQSQTDELKRSEGIAKQAARALEERTVELEESQKSLESSYKYKSEFLANMSHELRTPLNSILLLSDLMVKDKNNPPDTVKHADIIEVSANNLLKLINQILDLAKLETGRITAQYHVVTNLVELFEPVLKELGPLAAEKQLTLHDELSNLPNEWVTDPIRVGQITRNLLSNAIKYSDEGSVTLRVAGLEEGVKIEVEDTGIGISKKDQQNIFKAFVQVDGSNTRAKGGTGLGLAITHELITALNGKVGLKSEVGKGSIFSVVIPLKPAEGIEVIPSEYSYVQDNKLLSYSPDKQQARHHRKNVDVSHQYTRHGEHADVVDMASHASDLNGQTDHQADSQLESDHQAEPINILIVEDDIELRTSLTTFTKGFGFTPYPVNCLKSAKSLLQQTQFMGCLLDLSLSDGDGLALLDQIDTMETQLPIIIYSGRELAEHQVAELEAKGSAIIIKGEGAQIRLKDELMKIKQKWLELQKQQETPLVHEVPKRETVINKPVKPHSVSRAVEGVKEIMQSHAQPATESTKKTIMIVDDDVRNCYALSLQLNKQGFRTLLADNGQTALKKLKEYDPGEIDLILMDTMMPEMDGLDCIQRIRSNPSYQMIPIISVTAKASEKDYEESIAAGADAYINKPIVFAQLQEKLNQFFNQES